MKKGYKGKGPCSEGVKVGTEKGTKGNYASTSFAKTPAVKKGKAKPHSGGGGPAGKAG